MRKTYGKGPKANTVIHDLSADIADGEFLDCNDPRIATMSMPSPILPSCSCTLASVRSSTVLPFRVSTAMRAGRPCASSSWPS